jgi:hypothetical protein
MPFFQYEMKLQGLGNRYLRHLKAERLVSFCQSWTGLGFGNYELWGKHWDVIGLIATGFHIVNGLNMQCQCEFLTQQLGLECSFNSVHLSSIGRVFQVWLLDLRLLLLLCFDYIFAWSSQLRKVEQNLLWVLITRLNCVWQICSEDTECKWAPLL